MWDDGGEECTHRSVLEWFRETKTNWGELFEIVLLVSALTEPLPRRCSWARALEGAQPLAASRVASSALQRVLSSRCYEVSAPLTGSRDGLGGLHEFVFQYIQLFSTYSFYCWRSGRQKVDEPDWLKHGKLSILMVQRHTD